jgi:hypothetical protein
VRGADEGQCLGQAAAAAGARRMGMATVEKEKVRSLLLLLFSLFIIFSS